MTNKKKSRLNTFCYDTKVSSGIELIRTLLMSRFPEAGDQIGAARMSINFFINRVAVPYTLIKILTDEFEVDWYEYMLRPGKNGEDDGLFSLFRKAIELNKEHEEVSKVLTDEPDIEFEDSPEVLDVDDADFPIDLSVKPEIPEVEEDGLTPLSKEDLNEYWNMLK